MIKILRCALTSLAVVMAAQAAPASSEEGKAQKNFPWKPLIGKWEDCYEKCNVNEFAYCVMSTSIFNNQCSYSTTQAPPNFKACLFGKRPFCSPVSEYPNVINYPMLAKSGAVWRGTAPFCNADCGDGYFALCRSVDGKTCDFSSAIDASQLPGSFGASCAYGRKAYCVPNGVMFNGP